MNRKSRKKFLSFVLCFAMLFTLLIPIPAGANGEIGDSIIPPDDLIMPLVGTLVTMQLLILSMKKKQLQMA